MYRKTELFYEPLKEPYDIMKPIEEGFPAGEMSKEEQAFLCGLIRANSPKKLLEIGVAAGGTTAVIGNCLSKVSPDARMYSVDISSRYYRAPEKESTGYLYNQVNERLRFANFHKFMLGRSIPFWIDEIGAGIDFLVLDTVHSLPGEVLDFLCVLPYLSDGAIVVMHDINYNLLSTYSNGVNSYATKVLFSSVRAGEKYYDFDSPRTNIAAFRVNCDTREDVWNVFSSLSITWEYIPTMVDIKKYTSIFLRHYGITEALEEWLKSLLYLQEKAQAKKIGNVDKEIEHIRETVKKHNSTYIYGTGLKGARMVDLLDKIQISGFCVSDNYPTEGEYLGKSVRHISEVSVGEGIVVLASDSEECLWHIYENEIPHVVVSDRLWKTYNCL